MVTKRPSQGLPTYVGKRPYPPRHATFKLDAVRYLQGGGGTLFPPSYQEYATDHLECPVCGQAVVRLYLVAPGKVEASGAAYHHGQLFLTFRHPNDEDEPPRLLGYELIDPKIPAAVEVRSCRVACRISDLATANIHAMIDLLRALKREGALIEQQPRLFGRAP